MSQPAASAIDEAVRDQFLTELGWNGAHDYVRRGIPAHGPADQRRQVVSLAAKHAVTIKATSTRYRADLQFGSAQWSTWSPYPLDHAMLAVAITLLSWQHAMHAGETERYWGCSDVEELRSIDSPAQDAQADTPRRRLLRDSLNLLKPGPYASTPTSSSPVAHTLAALLTDTVNVGHVVSDLTVVRITPAAVANVGLVRTAEALSGKPTSRLRARS